jgi:hypothetical protein
MIELDGKLISLDVFEKKFVCDLNACKGACCVQGDAGAPLTEEEAAILDDIYEDVKPYLRPEGIAAIEKQGKYYIDWDNEPVTTLVNNNECAYAIFDDKGTALCGIEKAYNEGKVSLKKPISCHLYPIRVAKLSEYEAVNYNEWKICKPACACGEQLNVKVFRFLKEAIIRKWGKAFYEELEKIDKELEKRVKS